ncbi:MAG TPA: phytanoyl-CoA dioxygenase [Planctomycetaceae bacterium]|jgi:phytanoyl-CoA hydroxylase|nr:phytanoyl-CoA dioxygenase [Planctomycetaceae bacterium]|tara:strand:+ start:4167 stop:4961 length:795 start_codon:yes stop_codon:yes gene_type:complete
MIDDATPVATATGVEEYTRYREDYLRDGFVVVRDFFTGEGFDELAGELDRYVAEVVPTLPDSDAFFQDRKSPETLKQMQHMIDPFFVEYGTREPFVSLAEALMGEPVRAQKPEWFNKPPGTDHPTPPHQDNFYINLDPPPLTMWLAMDPVDAENGCLRYCTGTHREGLRPHARTQVLGFSQGISDWNEEDEAREVQVFLEPGDLAVHHGELIHRADPNRTTDRHRRAFALVYYAGSAERNTEAHQQYMQQVTQQHEGMGLEADG